MGFLDYLFFGYIYLEIIICEKGKLRYRGQ